jgi:hypothetical protein
MATKKVKPTGVHTVHSDEIVDTICERLAQGESLASICRDAGMPGRSTFMNWLLQNKHEGLQDKYARAREAQADFYAEQIIEISDEESLMSKHSEEGEVEVVFDSTAVARNRLRVDARKWYASKVAPKKYGDKQQVEFTGKVDVVSALAAARNRIKAP